MLGGDYNSFSQIYFSIFCTNLVKHGTVFVLLYVNSMQLYNKYTKKTYSLIYTFTLQFPSAFIRPKTYSSSQKSPCLIVYLTVDAHYWPIHIEFKMGLVQAFFIRPGPLLFKALKI